jgi:uncharacterized protein with NRDE domain
MCTIAILLGVADAPLVLAANRDELYARPTRPPEVLSRAPAITIGGVDVISGGTWLAVRADGRFAAVTNQRALDPTPGKRSRGTAVYELALAADPDAYIAAIDPRDYASMNLAWGNADRVRVAYLRRDGTRDIAELPRGVHVMCNDRIGAPGFPRGDRLAAAIERALADPRTRSWPALAEPLAVALRDHTHVDEPDVPPSHLLPALARELTATCIHGEHYGTRSSTMVAIDRAHVRAYLHADGAPCTHPFVDRTELLS